MTIAGVLNIDKPSGLTSHDVVARLRRTTGIRRIGHAGTLDPLATGVLVVCLGRATRLIEYLIGQDKTYETTIRLGQTTDTYDADGEIVVERPADVTPEAIAAALEAFRGPIRQRAPAYSAIKRDGQPLYKLARRGEAVDPPVRDVTIHALEMLSYEPPLLTLRVACSSGTYIRSLAHDLGQALGCGGHVVALRRTAVGPFDIAAAVALDSLTPENWQAHLLPPDAAVAHLPAVAVNAEGSRALRLGQQAGDAAAYPPDTAARVYDDDGRFLGVAVAAGECWQPRKMLLNQDG